jgi:penicillin-binding protein 2
MIGPSSGGGPSSDDRLPPMNSQLALRVAIVGTVALVMFAIIFLRLWFLQVLTGSSYVAQAKTNITRKVPVAAPRGAILASDGTTVLVDSEKVPAILVQPQELPVALVSTPQGLKHQPARDYTVYRRLERALGMKTTASRCTFSLTYDNRAGALVTHEFSPQLAEVPCIIAQHAADITEGDITIATNVPIAEQAYISERQPQFTGVQVSQVSVSKYPQGELAAQLLGTVGSNSDAGTDKRLFTGVPAYDDVGQTGLEYQYNKDLQGKDGYARVEVNAEGAYQRDSTPVKAVAGDNLRTSINLPLEKVGTQSLQESITTNGDNDGGVFVAMNPQNGQVYGMGSLPSYNPETLLDPDLSQTTYDRLFRDNPEDPLYNRAIQSEGLDGSTFKVITGTAALESMAWTPDKVFDDVGQVTQSGQVFHNAPGDGAQGAITMPEAIEVSDDDFFYTMGALMNPNPATEPQGSALQTWARKFGIGQRPDIDLPYASAGTVPTPALISTQVREERECDDATGEFAYTNGTNTSAKQLAGYHRSPKHLPGGCGIADASTLGWTIGDNMLAAIGQGDVQVSPLQLAMVYSAIENGGTLVTPHIGADIQTADGTVVQKINPGPERKLDINPTDLATIQDGLRLAASGPSGTSTDVMGSFKLPVYGKTGTADYKPTSGPDAGQDTAYAWYSCYVPASATSKPIEIVVWVEDGGYGDVAAAPVARQILSQWFYNTPGPYVTGKSTDQ